MQEKRYKTFNCKKLSGTQLKWLIHEKELFVVVHSLKAWKHFLRGREIKVCIDNISFKNFTSKTQVFPKELRQYDVIVLMDIEFITKSGKNILVIDALSRRKEFIEEKLHDTMSLKIIVNCDDFLLIKCIKEDYEKDEDALEIKKVFVQIKIIKKLRRLIEVFSIKDELI